MRYEYHNFTENLKAVQNTKDINMTRELILSELTKVIEGRPSMVQKALISCGVSIDPRPSKRDLVGAVAFNLTDLCVRTRMMELIVANQLPFIKSSNPLGNEKVSSFDTDVSRDAFMNQAGNNSSSKSGVTTNDLIGTGLDVFGKIIGINTANKTFKNAAEQRAHELQIAKINQSTMLAQLEAGANQNVGGVTQAGIGGGSTITYILLGVGALAIIGFAIYSSRKKD